MKREISFRGKQVDSNNWIEGSLILLKRKFGIGYYINQISSIICQLPVDPETVGQFTGRFLNDKRLFEGDKIKMKFSATRNERGHFEKLNIFFKNECFCAVNATRYIPVCNIPDSAKIIGNIYDNPELINN